MKRMIVLFALVLLLGITSILLAFMPYHFYYVALDSGIDSRFLSTNQVADVYLSGKLMQVDKDIPTTFNGQDRWLDFHVGDYIVPLPVRHPYFLLVPEIGVDEQLKPKIAWSLKNQSFKTEVRVHYLPSLSYEYPIEQNLLFSLPIFRNHLLKISSDKIWQDLFMLDLRLPSSEILGFTKWVSTLWQIEYKELAYRLFILKTRQAIFPKGVTSLSFDIDKQMGILEMVPEKTQDLVDDNLRFEQVLLLREGRIQRVELVTRRFNNVAKAYRAQFMNSFSWRLSNPDQTVTLYNEFNQLSLKRKTDQEGMTYLFAGWSHVPKQEEFLRTMIQYLERGPKNMAHLPALYQYAYDVFGTTFSTIKENLRETEKRKLERKISEELRGEVDSLQNKEVVAPDANFANPDDQVDYFLKRAKDSGVSDDENTLID